MTTEKAAQSLVNANKVENNDQMAEEEEVEDLLPGIPDHIKLKLADLVTHLDKCETVINKIDSKSNKDLQSTVISTQTQTQNFNILAEKLNFEFKNFN